MIASQVTYRALEQTTVVQVVQPAARKKYLPPVILTRPLVLRDLYLMSELYSGKPRTGAEDLTA